MAGTRSDEIVQIYDHKRPNGSSPFTTLKQNGTNYTKGAENIAKGAGLAKSVVVSWMNSPGHKKNILNSGLRYMGTGFTSVSNATHWVQLFADNNGSDCASITYVEELGYFILTLKNGTTAYAPYDPASSPNKDKGVTHNYPGAGVVKAAEKKTIPNGWYNLSTMGNYLNMTSKDFAELRKLSVNQAFYLKNKGNGKITLKLKNGTYLGVSSAKKDGIQLKAVKNEYSWTTYLERGTDVLSLRPAANISMVANASDEKSANGTKVIIWTHQNLDAPNHAEFRFIPTTAPKK